MGEKLDDMFCDCWCDGGIEDLSQGGKADNDLVDVSVGKVFDDGSDEHDKKIAVAIEEEGAHEVADAFEE